MDKKSRIHKSSKSNKRTSGKRKKKDFAYWGLEDNGIRLRPVTNALLFIAVLVAVLTIWGLYNVSVRYLELVDATDEYVSAEQSVNQLGNASDYLTNSAREFVLTGQISFASDFCTELYVVQRREHAIETIERNLTQEDESVLDFLKDALDYSNLLADYELHAMRLASLYYEIPTEEIPEQLLAYPLSEEELQMEPSDLLYEAYFNVFGVKYNQVKSKVTEDRDAATNQILKLVAARQKGESIGLKNALIRQRVYVILLIALIAISFSMVILLVIHPLRAYVRSIESEEQVVLAGSYEFRYLGKAYNQFYEMNLANRQALEHKVAHDALTGIFNREGYEDLTDVLRKSTESISFLLIDVDNFKQVNDTYGHEKGDETLKYVAQLLTTVFRADDYPIRIGGDEFALIMRGMSSKGMHVIESKIEKINDLLQKGTPLAPPCSISVGVAFSRSGFSDDLFERADKALYQTKENGRCGCSFG